MGRTSALKFSDITCRYPDALPVLTNLCELARIAEVNAEEMYLHKSESLQLLYVAAERTHGQLRRFAEQAGIGSSDVGSQGGQYGGAPALHLHNGNAHSSHKRASNADPPTVYYHSILLTFRPFLVTEALAGNRQKQGAMWLREACRHATDAAQDSLVFINNELVTTGCCKVRALRCLTINIHRSPGSKTNRDTSRRNTWEIPNVSVNPMPLRMVYLGIRASLVLMRPEDTALGDQVKPGPSYRRVVPVLLFHRSHRPRSRMFANSRFTAFFIESSCAVLLYDSLWHPAKHAYNLEYIHKGLHCLDSMVDAEPVLNARTSIRRMIGAVEQTIASRSSTHSESNTSAEAAVAPTTTVPGRLAPNATNQQSFTSTSERRNTTNPQACSETTFTSAANDFLYLSDRAHGQPGAAVSQSQTHAQGQGQLAPVNTAAASSASFDPNAAMMGGGDPMSLLDFDVLTTDLYSFFPIQTDGGAGDFGTR
jgi:hypothetical protein